jgi:hypothetical protein
MFLKKTAFGKELVGKTYTKAGFGKRTSQITEFRVLFGHYHQKFKKGSCHG